MSNAAVIWDFFKGKGLNDYAVAGIMGNLHAESALNPRNLQNTFEKKLGFTDDGYTEAVDSGSYGNFVRDGAGYGIAQWTFWSRKEKLLEFAKGMDRSIGDLPMQLEFMWQELQGYKGVMDVLMNAKSVLEASNAMLLQYERPADQSEAVQKKRAEYAAMYYETLRRDIMAVKICLDAGHYGLNNRSPVVPEYYESTMNWKLHKKLRTYLEEYGFEVIVTREKKGQDLALYDRGAASKGCDLFISIHSNAASSESVDRVDIYAPLDGKGHDIARKLADCIKEVMQVKQGAFVKTRKGSGGQDYYGVIRGATAVGTPGLLVEHSFHTNIRAAKWLLDEDNLDKLARAEAKVLAEHYGLAESAPAAGFKLGDRSLVKGMSGPDVAELKEALIRLGYGAADDEFDAATEEAVNQFKEDNGLEPNGKAGSGVFRKLAEKIAEEE